MNNNTRCKQCKYWQRQKSIEKQTNHQGAQAREEPLHCYMFKINIAKHCHQFRIVTSLGIKSNDS